MGLSFGSKKEAREDVFWQKQKDNRISNKFGRLGMQ